jgi:prophage antirepressor-like protein
MNHSEIVVAFESQDLKLVEIDGERYITTNALALGLDAKPRSLKKLVQEMRSRGELKEGIHLKCIPIQTAGGTQTTTLITYKGVIRISMRSDSHRAIRFRDWAEDVLFSVMTGVAENTHELRALVERGLKEIGTANHEATKRACDLILSLKTGTAMVVPTSKIPDYRDSAYVTAIEWAKKYYSTYCFPCMNGGGKFERYVARRYVATYRRWPEHDQTTRLYAWVYSEINDRIFLEACFLEFLKNELSRVIGNGAAAPKAITAGEKR